MRIIDGNIFRGYLMTWKPGHQNWEQGMTTTETVISPVGSHSNHALLWLALSLTPGVGAGRGRKLVELFDGVERLFSASLTELEAAGLPAPAAQGIALGKSLELASDEIDRAKAFGGHVLGQD